jgi:hypothetical protein
MEINEGGKLQCWQLVILRRRLSVVVVVPAVMLDLRIKTGEDGPFLCREFVCSDVEMMIT